MAELGIIQTLWIGDSLSSMERLCLSSFFQNGHEVHLYVYSDVANIPPGIIVKDGDGKTVHRLTLIFLPKKINSNHE